MVRMFMMILCIALLILGTGLATASQPEAHAYSTRLVPENVRPGPVQPGYAWGEATLIRELGTDRLFLTLNFFGLESPHTETVLMRAAVEEAGQVLMRLHDGGFIAQEITSEQEEHPEILAALLDSELVIQVCDERYADGAIRGTFEGIVAVDIDATTWSAVKDLFY